MSDNGNSRKGARAEHAERNICALTGKETPRRDLVSLGTIRPSLSERIRKDFPDLTDADFISRAELRRYRSLYIQDLLEADSGELSDIDRQIAISLANQEVMAKNVEEDFSEHCTFGDRVSDHLAQFGGSWTFLICFGAFLAAWMAFNAYQNTGAFDPYPFILLNLILSTIAAVQAPIIMMSQRRTETKDRMRSLNDYRVNLKAELEIQHLHEKVDHLMNNQWRRLTEIQELQIEMMSERRK